MDKTWWQSWTAQWMSTLIQSDRWCPPCLFCVPLSHIRSYVTLTRCTISRHQRHYHREIFIPPRCPLTIGIYMQAQLAWRVIQNSRTTFIERDMSSSSHYVHNEKKLCHTWDSGSRKASTALDWKFKVRCRQIQLSANRVYEFSPDAGFDLVSLWKKKLPRKATVSLQRSTFDTSEIFKM